MWLTVSLFVAALTTVGGGGSSSPDHTPSTLVADEISNARELGAALAGQQGLPSFSSGDAFTPDGSAVTIYSIDWSTSTDGCSGRQLEMGATCPVGAILMHPAPDGCAQVDNATVRCDNRGPPSSSPSSSPVYVACYAPTGYSAQDLLITAVFPKHPFNCDKILRSIAGLFSMQNYGGSARNSAQISVKCEGAMGVLSSSSEKGQCETYYSCDTSSGCSGSKACNAKVPRMELSASESDAVCTDAFTTSLATGKACIHPVMCASNLCVGGRCSEELQEDGTNCTVDSECMSGKCALNEDATTHCCASDEGPTTRPTSPPPSTASTPAQSGASPFVDTVELLDQDERENESVTTSSQDTLVDTSRSRATHRPFRIETVFLLVVSIGFFV